MKLVIIESPNKKETLQKYLGSDYLIMASKGHVRDLPIKSMGVNVNNNFEPQYEILPDKKDVIKQIVEKAKKADNIFLATDPDREGEAISWHLAYCLGLKSNEKCRVAFNEISKDAVLKGINEPREINVDLVNAQQARRVLDRLVGYKISPILCKKLAPRLSAGRVQSVALKLICDREKEIIAFKPEEYWTIIVTLENGQKISFKSSLNQYKGKKIKITNNIDAEKTVNELKLNPFIVSKIKKSIVSTHAPAPFTTSTMQQDALNKLGFDLKKSSSLAQNLYEGVEIAGEGKNALITYIRTDSTRVSEQAQAQARDFVLKKFGSNYVPPKANIYSSKKNAQDAHEAIRPIDINKTPESLDGKIGKDQFRLYKLIYERFLASQMSEAKYNSMIVDINCGDYSFKSSGKAVTFKGFTAIYENHIEKDINNDDIDDSKMLPPLEENEKLNLIDTFKEQKFTKPPARYNEASIVKTMEEKGIGRPATYNPTLQVLYFRNYITKDKKQILPTEIGFKVTDFLEQNFSGIIDVKFTANMETKLDEVEFGEVIWQDVIKKFYEYFEKRLSKVDSTSLKTPPVYAQVKCDKCGGEMVIRDGKFGKFLACENFPKCRNTKPLIQDNEDKSESGVCPKCGKAVLPRRSKKGKVFYGCTGYPECDFISWDMPLKEKCPVCGKTLYKKMSKTPKIYCEDNNCSYNHDADKPE